MDGDVAHSLGSDTYSIAMKRRRIANGGWEWFFEVGGTPVWLPPHQVGIYTDPDADPVAMFPRLLAAYAKAALP